MSDKIIVIGGTQLKYSSLKSRLKILERGTDFGTIDIVDLSTSKFENLIKTDQNSKFGTLKKGIDNKFNSSTFLGDKLLTCSGTEAFIYEWPSLKLINSFSHPLLNDVHDITEINDSYYLANTGLDSILIFSRNGDFKEIINTGETPIWDRFDKEVDYRKIPSTKPHLIHPNHVFEVNGEIYTTRFHQKDAVNIADHSDRFNIEFQRPHDGHLYGDRVYFTTVDGCIVSFDAKTKQDKCIHDLNKIFDWEISMGWCRSFCMKNNIAVVGFTALRKTSLERNIDWLKRTVNINEYSFLAVFDIKKNLPIKTIPIEKGHTDVIFSLHFID